MVGKKGSHRISECNIQRLENQQRFYKDVKIPQSVFILPSTLHNITCVILYIIDSVIFPGMQGFPHDSSMKIRRTPMNACLVILFICWLLSFLSHI